MNNPIRFIAVDVNTEDMQGIPTPELLITPATLAGIDRLRDSRTVGKR